MQITSVLVITLTIINLTSGFFINLQPVHPQTHDNDNKGAVCVIKPHYVQFDSDEETGRKEENKEKIDLKDVKVYVVNNIYRNKITLMSPENTRDEPSTQEDENSSEDSYPPTDEDDSNYENSDSADDAEDSEDPPEYSPTVSTSFTSPTSVDEYNPQISNTAQSIPVQPTYPVVPNYPMAPPSLNYPSQILPNPVSPMWPTPSVQTPPYYNAAPQYNHQMYSDHNYYPFSHHTGHHVHGPNHNYRPHGQHHYGNPIHVPNRKKKHKHKRKNNNKKHKNHGNINCIIITKNRKVLREKENPFFSLFGSRRALSSYVRSLRN